MRLGEVSIAEDAREIARDVDVDALYASALTAAERAYAPYSKFRAGAALLTRDGEIVTGCNVENCSYGLTICAERAAVARAVSEGHRDFVAIAVAPDTDRVHTVASCGACLQVLAEFDPDETLLAIFPEGDVLRVTLLSELLPVRFRLTD
jgi:cytidine deaminase